MTKLKKLFLIISLLIVFFACNSNLYRYSNWEYFGENDRYSYRYYEYRKGFFRQYSLGFKQYIIGYDADKNEFNETADSVMFAAIYNEEDSGPKPHKLEIDSFACQRYYNFGHFEVKNKTIAYKGLGEFGGFSETLKIGDTSYQSAFLLPFGTSWFPQQTYSNGGYLHSTIYRIPEYSWVGKHKFLVKYAGGNQELSALFQIESGFQFGLPKMDIHLFQFYIDNPSKNEYTYPITIAFDAKTGIPVLLFYYVYYFHIDEKPTSCFMVLDESTTIKSSKKMKKYSMFRK